MERVKKLKKLVEALAGDRYGAWVPVALPIARQQVVKMTRGQGHARPIPCTIKGYVARRYGPLNGKYLHVVLDTRPPRFVRAHLITDEEGEFIARDGDKWLVNGRVEMETPRTEFTLHDLLARWSRESEDKS